MKFSKALVTLASLGPLFLFDRAAAFGWPCIPDDEQCKKQDPENDICAAIGGSCQVDCEDDETFVCVPGLCSYDRKWDNSPKMRELKEEEVDVVDIEVAAVGSTERNLKKTKAPKATKAPKSTCACRVRRLPCYDN